MREILFRGKHTSSGKWIISPSIRQEADGSVYLLVKRTWYQVDSEAVGQYTGLTDKNGTKIFEGDIIKSPDNVICKVEWQPISASWQMSNKTSHYLFYMRCLDMFEVIGNIHDNPELLKEG